MYIEWINIEHELTLSVKPHSSNLGWAGLTLILAKIIALVWSEMTTEESIEDHRNVSIELVRDILDRAENMEEVTADSGHVTGKAEEFIEVLGVDR